jgi:hypothetical protein
MVGSSFVSKCWTMAEVADNDKHTSLQQHEINILVNSFDVRKASGINILWL